jgi:RND superfamily putative drug exporter
VVTAAALIMFFVFFAFVPEGSGAIKGIAFALAVGVFLDAFLVRMTLVPAAMALAGNAAWWLPRWLSRILPNVDIEGEGLRQHLDDSAWARTQTEDITAAGLIVGLPESRLGPIDLAVDSGSVLVLTGSDSARRVLAATLAGRLDPVAGRLQVRGAALPSDRSIAMRTVALADVSDSRDNGLTLGELLAERRDLVRSSFGSRNRQADLQHWVDRLNAALGAAEPEPLNLGTTVASLSALARAAALAAAALTERPGVLIVDLGDGLPADAAGRDPAAVFAALAPQGTTLILSAAALDRVDPAVIQERGLQRFDLGTISSSTAPTDTGKALHR